MFPLLRLHRVSRDEVLSMLTSIELFNLSLCSRITLLDVKGLVHRANRKCIPLISINEKCLTGVNCYQNDKKAIEWSVSINGINKLGFHNESQSKYVIGGIQFTGVINEDEKIIETYWKDKDVGLKTLFEFIENLYGRCADLYFESDESEQLIKVLDWVRNRSKPLEWARINLNSINNDHEIVTILDTVNITVCKELHLIMTPGEDFIKNDQRTYKFNFVSFRGGNYFNLQRLLSMKCPKIKAFNTILTNADIKLFVKQWMQGLHHELKVLLLEVKDLNIPLILSDIPHSKIEPATFQGYQISLAFRIRRSKSKSACIYEMPSNYIKEKNENINFVMYV